MTTPPLKIIAEESTPHWRAFFSHDEHGFEVGMDCGEAVGKLLVSNFEFGISPDLLEVEMNRQTRVIFRVNCPTCNGDGHSVLLTTRQSCPLCGGFGVYFEP